MKKHIRQFFREYNNPKDYEVWEQALMAAGDDKCDWTGTSGPVKRLSTCSRKRMRRLM